PTAALRVKPKRFFTTEAISVGIHRDAADGLASLQPVQRNPRVVARYSRGIRARANRDAKLQHFPHGRCALGGFPPITRNEIFTLIGHAMLNRDAAAQGLHAFEIAIGNRLTM